jgi:hypothetical protein
MPIYRARTVWRRGLRPALATQVKREPRGRLWQRQVAYREKFEQWPANKLYLTKYATAGRQISLGLPEPIAHLRKFNKGFHWGHEHNLDWRGDNFTLHESSAHTSLSSTLF